MPFSNVGTKLSASVLPRFQHMWTVFPPNQGLFATTPTVSWAWNKNCHCWWYTWDYPKTILVIFPPCWICFLKAHLIAMSARNRQAICYIRCPVLWNVSPELEYKPCSSVYHVHLLPVFLHAKHTRQIEIHQSHVLNLWLYLPVFSICDWLFAISTSKDKVKRYTQNVAV